MRWMRMNWATYEASPAARGESNRFACRIGDRRQRRKCKIEQQAAQFQLPLRFVDFRFAEAFSSAPLPRPSRRTPESELRGRLQAGRRVWLALPIVASHVGRDRDAFDLQKLLKLFGVHLRVMRGKRPSERTNPLKILPRTLKQRSSAHGMSSVASGKERQRLRIQSRSGIGIEVVLTSARLLRQLQAKSGILSWLNSIENPRSCLWRRCDRSRSAPISPGQPATVGALNLAAEKLPDTPTPGLGLRPAPPELPAFSCRGRWSLSPCRRRGGCS